MIKIEHTEVVGWEHAIRGMRNPMNSWDKSDSRRSKDGYRIGESDKILMRQLCNAGTDHRKFMRMIVVYCDITAPLYWWKEFDTYKVGTVANSCSTMHKLTAKKFSLDDFSHEYLNAVGDTTLRSIVQELNLLRETYLDEHTTKSIVRELNALRETYSDEHTTPEFKRFLWHAMIQLLPSSYNQKRTVMLNYEVLRNMYHARREHKLDEWRELCRWIEELPHSELIIGGNR